MNKYNAKTCFCQSGHCHQSDFERRYCDELRLRVKGKDIKGYQSQVKFSFDVNGVHITNYYADFVVTTNTGEVEIHETKGLKTDVYRLKKKLFGALYPDILFLEIPYRAKYRRRKTRRRY